MNIIKPNSEVPPAKTALVSFPELWPDYAGLAVQLSSAKAEASSALEASQYDTNVTFSAFVATSRGLKLAVETRNLVEVPYQVSPFRKPQQIQHKHLPRDKTLLLDELVVRVNLGDPEEELPITIMSRLPIDGDGDVYKVRLPNFLRLATPSIFLTVDPEYALAIPRYDTSDSEIAG